MMRADDAGRPTIQVSLPMTIVTSRGTVVLEEEGIGVKMPRSKKEPRLLGWGEAAVVIATLVR